MKISVIGAGAVGATLAQRIVEDGAADVVMVDIAKGMAQGKALDLLDASPMVCHERNVTGTDDYAQITSSAIVVITAGFPRKPGMSREDLVAKNANIVKTASQNIKKHCPDSIVIVVTNPLDVMTYLACKEIGFSRNKVFGMAGMLDSSRLAYLVADELKVPRSSVKTYVLGGHGDTMIPIISKTKVFDEPISNLMAKDKLDAIIRRVRDRGAEIVALLGSGSAYYSPSAAIFKIIKAVLDDTKETFAVSALLEGEYGLRDVCIGVPCRIGKGGIEEIVDLDISKDEMDAFRISADAIKKSIKML